MNHPLYELLSRLDQARYYYSLSRHRYDTVLITVTFVGERVEIDVFDDGHMEGSRFPGTEAVVGGEELIYKLIDQNEKEDNAEEE
jgi:hypothetical protein